MSMRLSQAVLQGFLLCIESGSTCVYAYVYICLCRCICVSVEACICMGGEPAVCLDWTPRLFDSAISA